MGQTGLCSKGGVRSELLSEGPPDEEIRVKGLRKQFAAEVGGVGKGRAVLLQVVRKLCK